MLQPVNLLTKSRPIKDVARNIFYFVFILYLYCIYIVCIYCILIIKFFSIPSRKQPNSMRTSDSGKNLPNKIHWFIVTHFIYINSAHVSFLILNWKFMNWKFMNSPKLRTSSLGNKTNVMVPSYRVFFDNLIKKYNYFYRLFSRGS